MTKFLLNRRYSAATIAIAAATVELCRARLRPGPAAGPGQLRKQGQSDQAIVVTGSRIRRDPLDQDNPVVFVDRDDIDRTGLTSVAEVLQRLAERAAAP